MAPVLVPSGPLPLSSLKESTITARLLEGEQLGAKCGAGKYVAAVGVKYTYDFKIHHFKNSQIRFVQLPNAGAAPDEAAGPRRGGGRLAGAHATAHATACLLLAATDLATKTKMADFFTLVTDTERQVGVRNTTTTSLQP